MELTRLGQEPEQRKEILTGLGVHPLFYPQLAVLNIMHLASPQSAILSAIIFNALIIIALIPLALKGVKYRAVGAGALLRRNLMVYGVGGIIIPFIGIKAIDLVVAALHLA